MFLKGKIKPQQGLLSHLQVLSIQMEMKPPLVNQVGLQWLSIPTPVPAWTPCVLRTVQSISLAVPLGPCATAVLLPYSCSECCVCFHSFFSPSERTKGNVPCDFSHSETNDNIFVGLFCRSVFLNSGLKSLKTTSDSMKLFIRGSFCPFILLLFCVLPAF